MGFCSVRCWLITGAVMGGVLAILGGILFPVGDSIIRDTVHKETVLENGTTAYEAWTVTSVAVYRELWLFEVTNPTEVVQLGAKPTVVERGPYTYKIRYLPKENITANSNHTISFVLPAGAIFQRDRSVGDEEDAISFLNLAVVGAYSMLPKLLHGRLNLAIKKHNASLFQSRTVKELLWGYDDPLLSPLLNLTVGVFVPYNDTYDGPYNVFTGKDDISKVSMIDRWKGETKLNYWNDKYCNMINGTDASSFPPFLDKKSPLYFFSSDICRSVSADFERSLVLKEIELYRYTLNPLTMAAPTENPDNRCYCSDPEVTRNCTTAGVLDVSACRENMPIFISLPHFLHGSPSLSQDVLGLKAIEEEHFTFLDVEPVTGMTMRFAKRLQVNMMYGPSKQIEVLNKVKDYTVFPLLWLNESAEVDDETAERFRKELTSRIETVEALRVALLAVGSVLFTACIITIAVTSSRRGKKA
ncbi:platelet glycoprotein 4 [Conger conger]|uniref:platelet glycoprotein 4 n=1 Tax=Conger conger TaxID=82655 RepID=UPI002A59C549|nr:platelet glycoprotein 4 [Conger conger]